MSRFDFISDTLVIEKKKEKKPETFNMEKFSNGEYKPGDIVYIDENNKIGIMNSYGGVPLNPRTIIGTVLESCPNTNEIIMRVCESPSDFSNGIIPNSTVRIQLY